MTGSRNAYAAELARLRERLQTVLQEALLRSPFVEGPGAAPGIWSPSADVVETDDAFVVSLELAGVPREDVELEVTGRRLEVFGRRPAPEAARFSRMERSYGSFRRRFDLPAPIDVDELSAELVDGVLTVTAPKRPAGRTIEIETEGE